MERGDCVYKVSIMDEGERRDRGEEGKHRHVAEDLSDSMRNNLNMGCVGPDVVRGFFGFVWPELEVDFPKRC